MGKFKDVLKRKVEDETAAFAILGAMIVTFVITIGVWEYIYYQKTVEANASLLNINLSSVSTSNSEKEENIIQNTNEIETAIENEDELKKKNEEEYEKLKEENKLSSQVDKYYIKVNYGAQVVTVYTKDSNGKYTVPVRAMVCSTGTYTPTSGTYRTLGKGNWWSLMGDVYGQYSTWICDDILFHSVPYLESGDKSSLEYWAYDQLGQRVSLGCVRLTVEDAKWIYSNCPVGTQVEFYSSSNPGPLGKPSTMKISDAPENVRGWDPTDPDPKNPWPEYLKKLEEEENNKDNNEDDNKDDNNDKVNDIVNDIVDEPVNDITNEVIDEPVNDIINEVVDEPINDIVNDVIDNPVNDVVEEPVNDMINDFKEDVINGN